MEGEGDSRVLAGSVSKWGWRMTGSALASERCFVHPFIFDKWGEVQERGHPGSGATRTWRMTGSAGRADRFCGIVFLFLREGAGRERRQVAP